MMEGDQWFKADKGAKTAAQGETAWDECVWFCFTTLHGIGFGEFMPRDSTGHVIACATIAMSYWYMIFMMAIVLLSQLPRSKTPSLIA